MTMLLDELVNPEFFGLESEDEELVFVVVLGLEGLFPLLSTATFLNDNVVVIPTIGTIAGKSS